MARILVVEDEAVITMLLKHILGQGNHEVVGVASTGERAVQLAREQSPDLVVMDITLKGAMDGIEAAKTIIDELHLPIIFMTSHSDQATLDRTKAVRPAGFLLKPIKDKDFLYRRYRAGRHLRVRSLRR